MFNKLSYFVIAAALFSITVAAQSPKELSRWQAQAENVDIIRDDFGIPHVYGKTDTDAIFGLLYTQCEDAFNRVEQNYIWATGRLADVLHRRFDRRRYRKDFYGKNQGVL